MKRVLFILLAIFMFIIPSTNVSAETVVQMGYTVVMPDVTREGLYTGEVLNGIPHGYGVFAAVNSSGMPWHYLGQWVDGKMCGQGGQYWDFGQTVVGTFENNDSVDGYKSPSWDVAGKPMTEWETADLKWLVDAINLEIEARSGKITSRKKEVTVPAGEYTVGMDIPADVYSIKTTSFMSMITIHNKNGEYDSMYSISQDNPVGKVSLKDGQQVKISGGSVIFAPYEGLGFQ